MLIKAAGGIYICTSTRVWRVLYKTSLLLLIILEFINLLLQITRICSSGQYHPPLRAMIVPLVVNQLPL